MQTHTWQTTSEQIPHRKCPASSSFSCKGISTPRALPELSASPGHEIDAPPGSLLARAEVWQNGTATEDAEKGYGSRAQVLVLAIPGNRGYRLPHRKACSPAPTARSALNSAATTLYHLSHNGLSLEMLHSYKFTCCPADSQPAGRRSSAEMANA